MLILIRGIPGSGKSTLAKKWVTDSNQNLHHLETDMFFTETNGHYLFNKNKLSQAHRWCQDNTKRKLEKGQSVIVSNTFVQRWELQPYLNMAKALDVEVQVIVCSGAYGNVHGIPDHTIEKMKLKWQSFPED